MWLDRVCKSQTYVMSTPSKIGKPEFSSGLWLVLHLAKVCGPPSPELAGKANLTKFDGIQTGMIRWEPTCCWLDKCWKNIDQKYLDKYMNKYRQIQTNIKKIETGMIPWEPLCCWLDKCWKRYDTFSKYICFTCQKIKASNISECEISVKFLSSNVLKYLTTLYLFDNSLNRNLTSWNMKFVFKELSKG